MKFLKIAALFALASLPLLLVKKERTEGQGLLGELDSDSIFDQELSAD
jgi:hypothetical protein